MRRKKHKHTRRSVAFYKINHGFREPFKVLLDGNFIHAALAANMTHLQELLARLLGGEVKLFTTPCVSQELRGLGPDFQPAATFARQQQLHKCGHAGGSTAPSECLLAAVGGGNPQHWWVATQDAALQGSLGDQPAVPLLFASVNGLHLAQPAGAARASVAAGHAAAQALPAHELASEALRDLAELRPRDTSWKKFKRHKVKGPNPLSVKKKSRKPAAAAAAATPAAGPRQQAAADGSQAARRRTKRKKLKAPAAADE